MGTLSVPLRTLRTPVRTGEEALLIPHTSIAKANWWESGGSVPRPTPPWSIMETAQRKPTLTVVVRILQRRCMSRDSGPYPSVESLFCPQKGKGHHSGLQSLTYSCVTCCKLLALSVPLISNMPADGYRLSYPLLRTPSAISGSKVGQVAGLRSPFLPDPVPNACSLAH